jgi:hypothetical protein
MKERHNIIELLVEIYENDNNSLVEIEPSSAKLEDIQNLGYLVKEDNIIISKPLVDVSRFGSMAFIYLIIGETHPLFNLRTFANYDSTNNNLKDEYSDIAMQTLYEMYDYVVSILLSYGLDINSIEA